MIKFEALRQAIAARGGRQRNPPLMAELRAAKRPGRCALCDEPMRRIASPRQLVHPGACRREWTALYYSVRRMALARERRAR